MVTDETKHHTEAQEAGQVDEESLAEATPVVDDGQDAEEREQLEQELETVRDQLMRIAAEFENYKKRMEREQAKTARYAGENILRELLPTVDNLERAMEQGADGNADLTGKLNGLLEGVGLTHKGLLAMLERFGVQPIESVGQAFNPGEQDALVMETSSEVPANHVLREFAKGYRFKDRMLRHAQVVVSSGPGA
ncbi:MAG: nucleotide exchange factor GrpE [Desulfobulbaceae bacterium]|nr:nucleotide exchange factor GrpE [Desulfobulbaceae bacterium]